MTASGPAPGPRVPRGPWLAIVGAALLARLAFALLMPPRILWPDGLEYEAVARSLLLHGTYGLQTLRPPGYPTLIAGVYALFGENLLALRVVEALMGAASVAIVGLAGAATFGRSAGLLAATLMALHPVLAFLPSTQYSENTLVLVLAAAFASAFAAWRRGALGWWALAGALFGIGALVRPTTVFLLPGLGLGLVLLLRRERRGIQPVVVALVALVTIVAPWVVRSHRVHGQWFFVATGGGRQFWVGNNARATAETSSPTQWNAAERESLASYPDEIARERWHYREGLRFVRAEPVRAAGLYLKEITNLFALWPETFSRAVAIGGLGRWAQGAATLTIFAGALLALARLRAEPLLVPLWLAIASFTLASAAFFTVMRYRMVIEPCLLWLAGFGSGTLVSGSVDDAVAEEGPDGFEPVAPSDLLSLGAGAVVIADRDLEDPLAALCHPGRDLGAELEPLAPERQRLEQRGAEDLVAGRLVGEPRAVEEVRHRVQQEDGHLEVGEWKGIVAPQVARAVDHVRAARQDRLHQPGIVLGVVLEIGVLDDDDLAPRLGERGADGVSFSAIPLVGEGADRHPPGQLREHLAGAVAGAVVHHDHFLVDRHRQHAFEQRLEGGMLVVDRHQNREQGRAQGRIPRRMGTPGARRGPSGAGGWRTGPVADRRGGPRGPGERFMLPDRAPGRGPGSGDLA